MLMLGKRHATDAQFLGQFPCSGLGIALVCLHHTACRHIPVAGINGFAQGTAMHAQLACRIEQQNISATPDQTGLTQLRADHAPEWLIQLVNLCDQFSVRGGAVRSLVDENDIDQPRDSS